MPMTKPNPQADDAAPWKVLHDDLKRSLKDAVHFDAGHRAAYSSDASNYRQVPIGVVVPRTMDEVVTAVEICRKHDAPILMRGGGTSQSGQCVNVAVVLDHSRHCNAIVELDPVHFFAIVEPGVICDTLRNAAEAHGLTFAPDPATHSRCTLGGMIANNSCGAHSVMAGKTVENVEALEVMTYDGERFWVGPTTEQELEEIISAGGRKGQIYRDLRDLRDRYADLIRARFPNIKRRVSGYNLDQLLPENGFNVARALVGTEGTCALTLQAKVRLVKSPRHRVLLVLGFADIYTAADLVPEYMPFGPIAIEGLDRTMIRGLEARGLRKDEIALLPEGDAWVVIEFGADTVDEAVAQAERAQQYFEAGWSTITSRVVVDTAMQKKIWLIRETGASATSLSIDPDVPDPQVGWEDAAVDPNRLGDYLRAFQALVDRYGYKTSMYGHFGDGCMHARITFDFRTADSVKHWRSFTREAAELVVAFGGSLSGEHGDGQAKAEFLPIMFGEELMGALHRFKEIWDPRNRMNPGKVVNANPIDENLRMGPDYKVIKINSRLNFRSQEGDGFQRAVERCIGMGRCRSLEGGTMCPSYRASGDERFSTRGRAHLLWEMLQGEVIRDGWKSEDVKAALDTCLSCKGCRSDCPTHTDMASYKAEFFSHYYENRRRPRQALTMGQIGDWAPLAAKLPWLANFFTQTPFIGSLSKRIGGVANSRRLPKFSPKTFRSLAPLQSDTNGSGSLPKVMLWVDTFSEHFHPEVALAASRVLRDAGFDVVLPREHVCCGRPLYDFGYLDQARAKLRKAVEVLSEDAGNVVGVVGLEPGCLSVFKEELPKHFPDDPRARHIASNTWLLGDFLVAKNYSPPPLEVDVLVHAHCHQKAVFSSNSDHTLMTRMRASVKTLDSGCCGMAGSFGFNPEHVALSRAIGEQVLLPAVRKANETTYILTNGFSCREQIEQGTGRKVVHLAEILDLAVKQSVPKERGKPSLDRV
jgi:FAD/FMN-containing dehydrogenase/Fe-S oxidoreductase